MSGKNRLEVRTRIEGPTCWKCGAAPLVASDPPMTNTFPLTHLLESNDPPLEPEIPIIRSIIAAQQDSLTSLDIEIHDMQIALAQLLARRDASAKMLLKYQAITSAVRRVPSELVCEIFALTLEGKGPDQAGVKPPWRLGHICRSWRRSALQYSLLWNQIEIPTESTESFNPSMLETQLLRSARASLDVLWLAEVEAPPLDLVLAHSPRWHSLCLHVDEEDDEMLNRLHRVNGRLDRLEILELVKAHGTVIPDVFQDAQALRQVILTDWEFHYPSPVAQIPWAQITRYRGMYSWQRQLQILAAAAPSLRECAVAYDHLMQTESLIDEDDAPPIVLPQLRRICTASPDLLRRLTAPLLDTIYSVYHSDNLVPLLPPFISRSACTITTLVLMHCGISPDSDLVAVLRSLPSLTYLAIEPDDLQETRVQQLALLRAMTATVSATGAHELCPKLTSLVYGMNADFSHTTFFEMAHSRLHGIGSLTQLRLFPVRYVHGFQDVVMMRLNPLRHCGFDAALLDSAGVDLLRGKGFFSP
ncbi:hypothetical protein C8R46DRAFT_258854 [Mycena filopes]|nr:hypothetical protein C8R46DRAFT_258854 [Mycena filopes]